jgi:hypothetical protein
MRKTHATFDEVRSLYETGRASFGAQVGCGELYVLRHHPHVYAVWRRLNPGWRIELAHHPKWGEGYELFFEIESCGEVGRSYWNRHDRDGYNAGHPASVWNGVWRETRHRFVEDLMWLVGGHAGSEDTEAMRAAARAGLRVYRRVTPPADIPLGSRYERASGEIVEVVGARDDELIVRPLGRPKACHQRLSVQAVRAGRVSPVPA